MGFPFGVEGSEVGERLEIGCGPDALFMAALFHLPDEALCIPTNGNVPCPYKNKKTEQE
jgi:hypothetical protein